jgi:hypothetical protein
MSAASDPVRASAEEEVEGRAMATRTFTLKRESIVKMVAVMEAGCLVVEGAPGNNRLPSMPRRSPERGRDQSEEHAATPKCEVGELLGVIFRATPSGTRTAHTRSRRGRPESGKAQSAQVKRSK